jgi:hypothetical protein
MHDQATADPAVDQVERALAASLGMITGLIGDQADEPRDLVDAERGKLYPVTWSERQLRLLRFGLRKALSAPWGPPGPAVLTAQAEAPAVAGEAHGPAV